MTSPKRAHPCPICRKPSKRGWCPACKRLQEQIHAAHQSGEGPSPPRLLTPVRISPERVPPED
jgi:hypothetical protein